MLDVFLSSAPSVDVITPSLFALLGIIFLAGAVAAFPGERIGDPVPVPDPLAAMAQQLSSAPLPPQTLRDSLVTRVITCSDLVAAERAVQPRTGASLGRARVGGLGILSINNGTANDAVAILRAGRGREVRRTYVRAHSSADVERIPVGDYELLFALGNHWIPEESRFCEPAAFSRFDETFLFQERRVGNSLRYSTWTVTLHPVSGGTTRASDIDASEFEPVP